MIEVRNLSVGYRKNAPLLKGYNAKFGGKIYTILGKSGIGKTTFLKTIAGLIKPLDGEVLIDGKVVKNAGNGVYMMHQQYTNFNWRTSLDNVLIAKQIKGLRDGDVERAKAALEAVGLSDCIDKFPSQMSGGQNQRLALARTLFAQPKVLLMDEPLSALDEKTRERMQNIILSQHKACNNTIIFVTHSIEEAKRMGDCIIEF